MKANIWMLEIVLHSTMAHLCRLVSKPLLVSRPAPAQGHMTHQYTLEKFIT